MAYGPWDFGDPGDTCTLWTEENHRPTTPKGLNVHSPGRSPGFPFIRKPTLKGLNQAPAAAHRGGCLPARVENPRYLEHRCAVNKAGWASQMITIGSACNTILADYKSAPLFVHDIFLVREG
jgi:hypothetical protein